MTKQTRQQGGATSKPSAGTRYLAWSLWAVSVALTGLGLALLISLRFSRPDVPVYQYWAHATAITLAFSTVGALIASRRPENPIGWLFCVTGLLVGIDHFCGEYAVYALLAHPGALPAGEAAAWIRSWIWIVSGALGVFLLLLFPDGRLPGNRWRYVAWLNVAVAALGSVVVAFSAGPVDAIAELRNPLGVYSLGPSVADTVEVLQVAVALTAAVSLLVRLRRAQPDERQQIKWFAYAAPVLILGALLSSPATEAWDARWVSWVGFALYIFGIVGLPAAVGVAILRHHLYDIDVLINRTLVYGVLTVSLALVYFGGVSLLQGLGSVFLQIPFRAVAGQESQLATVVATLAMAALFSPLLRRIQGLVDKRFYRRKYDARRTLEAFSAKLRNETDLDALSGDLVEAVRETVQPSHVSVWLRPGAVMGRPGRRDPPSEDAIRQSG